MSEKPEYITEKFKGEVAPWWADPARWQNVRHVHESSSGGSVKVEVEKNSRGVNVAIRIDRPMRQGEDALAVGAEIIAQIKVLMAAAKAEIDPPLTDSEIFVKRIEVP